MSTSGKRSRIFTFSRISAVKRLGKILLFQTRRADSACMTQWPERKRGYSASVNPLKGHGWKFVLNRFSLFSSFLMIISVKKRRWKWERKSARFSTCWKGGRLLRKTAASIRFMKNWRAGKRKPGWNIFPVKGFIKKSLSGSRNRKAWCREMKRHICVWSIWGKLQILSWMGNRQVK